MLNVQIKVVGDLKALGAAIESDIDKLQQELAYRIVDEARILMKGTKTGRLYRRGSMRGRRTKQGIEAGLRQWGKSRMITGSRFHRASAPGEAVAIDTGRAYRDIKVTRMKRGSYRVRFGGWVGYWEFEVPPSMQRPTIIPAVQAAVEKMFV